MQKHFHAYLSRNTNTLGLIHFWKQELIGIKENLEYAPEIFQKRLVIEQIVIWVGQINVLFDTLRGVVNSHKR